MNWQTFQAIRLAAQGDVETVHTIRVPDMHGYELSYDWLPEPNQTTKVFSIRYGETTSEPPANLRHTTDKANSAQD